LQLQDPIGKDAAAGTAIRQHFGYGVYMYAGRSAVLLKDQFTFRQGAIAGRCLNVCENFAFWPGAKYFKVILLNFNNVTFQFKDVSLTEINLEEAMKDNQAEQPKKPGDLYYHPVTTPGFQMEGLAFFAQEKQFRRFPLQPNPALPGSVESLSCHSAGAMLRFRSNTRRLAIKVRIENFPGFDHMSRIGQAGVDLYLGKPGEMVFHSVSRISTQPEDYQAELFKLPDEEPAQMQEFTLHLPTYSKTADLQIGLDADAEIQPPTPRSAPGRIVVYGTSITQGACASRPGLSYTSQLARKLNREILNFGFSGSGRGEAEVATHLARLPQIDLFILDSEANVESLATMQQRLPIFLDILRKQQPDCKILLVSAIPFAGQAAFKQRPEYTASRNWQQELVRERNEVGDRKLFFLDGGTLLGEDIGECYVDGVHPNDLGMTLMQQAMLPVIRKILESALNQTTREQENASLP
jgi:lysophospholipase L1-like esterase